MRVAVAPLRCARRLAEPLRQVLLRTYGRSPYHRNIQPGKEEGKPVSTQDPSPFPTRHLTLSLLEAGIPFVLAQTGLGGHLEENCEAVGQLACSPWTHLHVSSSSTRPEMPSDFVPALGGCWAGPTSGSSRGGVTP
jgi:hypothetical protein